MFGGWGIYEQDVMFALIAYDELYLKVDEQTQPYFEQGDGRQFLYERPDGKLIGMSYWRPGDAVLDDGEALLEWATLAVAAARRAKQPKKKKRAAPKKQTPRMTDKKKKKAKRR